ncbi:MAG: FHA domain-containing protein [Anaerolineales bacterium]|nr:FHA domain-containing protein [Anaerolineales bacterium]
MSPAAFRFIVRTGPNPGTAFDIVKERTLFGRDVTCDIVIGDAEVSREHARLTRTPGGYVVEDLGSTNGTFVNGERIMAPRVLNSGDLVGLSENVTLTFSSTSPESASTVISSPVSPQTAPPRPTPEAARGKTPSRAPIPQPDIESEAEPKKRSPWLYAGCGCLVLLVILIVVGILMDMYMPDVLYAPLKMLGF